MRKKSILILLVIVFGVGYYILREREEARNDQINFATWRKFTPRSGLFEVLVPGNPQYVKDYLPIPNTDLKKRYDIYVSEKVDGTTFLINVISYPADYEIKSSKETIHQNIEELKSNRTNNPLNTLWEEMLADGKSLNFAFENQDYRIQGHSIHDDRIIYLLSYISKKETFDDDEYEYFIRSFKLLNSKKDTVQPKS